MNNCVQLCDPQPGLEVMRSSSSDDGSEALGVCGTRDKNNGRLLRDRASAAVLDIPGMCAAEK